MKRLFVLVLLAAACGGEPGPSVAGGTAVYCATELPDQVVAFVSPDLGAADLRPILFTPLVLYDNDGSVRPYLARSWEWSDGARALRFDLRADVRWHDGTPVTAEDVAWTIRAAADSTMPYWRRLDFTTLTSVSAADGSVSLTFSAPFVAGLEPFIALPILPRHLLAELSPEEFRIAPYHRQPVGSGPFRVAARNADGSIVLERNPDFPEDLGRAQLQRLVLRLLPDPATAVIELRTGGVDLCELGSSSARDVATAGDLTALPLEPAAVQVLPLDTRQAPFDDRRVRRAISAALVREQIAASISPLAQPAGTFMPAASSRWLDRAWLQPDADPALVDALLDSAGFGQTRSDGIRVDGSGRPLEFTIVGPRAYENLLTVVQAQLRTAGMDARIQLMEGAAYIAALQDPDRRPGFMALAFAPDELVLPDPTDELATDGGSNLASYSNPIVDSLLRELASVIPDERRREIYSELQRIVSMDAPMIYTVYAPRMLAVGPRLQGVEPDLNGAFGSASRWHVSQ